jgi:hypothetical protein
MGKLIFAQEVKKLVVSGICTSTETKLYVYGGKI